MSNLGYYQLITTMAKRVGGPRKLCFYIATVGYVGGRTIEWLTKKGLSIYRGWREKHDRPMEEVEEYTVREDGVDDQGLKLSKGDCIRILEKDGTAVLIEKVGDDNNPYFVSEGFLKDTVGYVAG